MLDESSVGDFVTLRRGTTYKGPLVGKPGPALLGLGSIVPGGGFRGDYKTYGGECPPELMLAPGDLYVSLKGATKAGDMIGSVARVPSTVPTGRLTQDTVRLVFRERNAAFQSYLYWLLRTHDYRNYCARRATGSAVVALSREDFLAYPVPPLTTFRRRVVEVLENIDDKIESNRRAIDLTLQLLDALAVKVAPEVPATSLGAVVAVSRDTINPTQLDDEIVDHYSLPAFDEGARPERVPATAIMSNKLVIPNRSILLSRLNPRFNRTWWVSPDAGVRALASTEFLCLTASDDEALAAVWLAVRDVYFRSELPRRVTGTSGSHQRVRPDDALAIEVPDVARLQEKTKRTALATLASIEQNRHEIARLSKFRETLLSVLLSGRVHLPKAEKAVAEVVA